MMISTVPFESSVNSYGRKTFALSFINSCVFESSVNSYGRKTFTIFLIAS